MQRQEMDDRLWMALRDGPIGREIEAQAEAERAAKCAQLRQELEAGQAKYQTDLGRMQERLDRLSSEVGALKKQIEPLEAEWQKLSWLVADKRGAMTEHRDRYWRQIGAVADPRIKAYRQEFEARFRGIEKMARAWQSGPARS